MKTFKDSAGITWPYTTIVVGRSLGLRFHDPQTGDIYDPAKQVIDPPILRWLDPIYVVL